MKRIIYPTDDGGVAIIIPAVECGLSIEEIDTTSGDHECVHEQVKPEGITDNEMIDFINQNTLYTRQEIIDKIKSGERDLEDYYLDIADIVKRKEIMGF